MDLNILTNTNDRYTLPTAPAFHNENLVRAEITKNDHPHPILLIGIVIIILLILFVIYTALVKSDFNGKWYFEDGQHTIRHNKWNNTITIDNIIDGWVDGNSIYIKSFGIAGMGVLHGKKIHWAGSNAIWQRATKAARVS